MREFFRPYTQIITLTNLTKSQVFLNDTSGTPISCNYVTVHPVSSSASNPDGIFSIIPVGLNGSLNTPAGSQATADSMGDNTGSGITGVVTSQAGGVATLALGPFDSINSIYISQSNEKDTTYAVTYGIVSLANPKADEVSARFMGR